MIARILFVLSLGSAGAFAQNVPHSGTAATPYKPGRGVPREFAPRGADSGVPGTLGDFHPAAMPKFKPFVRSKKPTLADTVQLVFLARTHPVRVEVRITAAGGTLIDRWDTNLRTLFTAFDRDRDGSLNRHEVERIFSQGEFRQIVQGGYGFRGQGAPPTLDALDRDGDSRVSFEELADYYEAEAGAVLKPRVSSVPNYNQQADSLTPELFARFDKNSDGQLSEAELKNAEQIVPKLDGDEDECVSGAEILANPVRKLVAAAGPGTAKMENMAAMSGMSGPSAGSNVAAQPDDFQAYPGTLPGAVVQQTIKKYDKNGDNTLGRAEIGFEKAVFDKLDTNKDDKLSAAELDVWRTGPAELTAKLELGPAAEEARFRLAPEKGTAHVQVTAEGNRAVLLVGAQTVDVAPFSIPESARPQRQNPYAYVFPQNKSVITEADLAGPQNQFLRVLFEPADWNGDGQLTRVEFDRYFELQRTIGELGVALSHSTRTPNFFQLIDQNGDGKLGVRELRTAYRRIAPLEPTGGKDITRAILQPSVVVRVGPALTAAFDQSLYNTGTTAVMPSIPTHGPLWFRKMDRNGDGDVSRAEFLGTKAQFDAIDTDRDELLTLAEAETFDKKARPGTEK